MRSFEDSILPTLVMLSHCFVLRTEVKLTPPEMINRNAKHILIIKTNHHLDRRKKTRTLETKPTAAEPTPLMKLIVSNRCRP